MSLHKNNTFVCNPHKILNEEELHHFVCHNTKMSNCAHVEGYNCTASGEYSHAEGYSSIAFGKSSHAEGHNTSSKGCCSHSEGRNTISCGDSSHAEGSFSIASELGAHAQGIKTVAKGTGSFSSGEAQNINEIIASGKGSYANGLTNNGLIWSQNNGSFAQGYMTDNAQLIANGSGCTSIGCGTGEGSIQNIYSVEGSSARGVIGFEDLIINPYVPLQQQQQQNKFTTIPVTIFTSKNQIQNIYGVVGSETHGVALGNSQLQNILNVYGADVAGFANTESKIQNTDNVQGCNVHGFAEVNSSLQNVTNVQGCDIHGYSSNASNLINSDSVQGCNIQGYALNGSTMTNQYSVNGCDIHGFSVNSSTITNYNDVVGSSIVGCANNESILRNMDTVYGCKISGRAYSIGIIENSNNVDGSFAHGGCGVNSLISNNNFVSGCDAHGMTVNNGTLMNTFNVAGSKAEGMASFDSAIINTTYVGGSLAQGLSAYNSNISNNNGVSGSDARGMAITGGIIQNNGTIYGSSAIGYASSGTIRNVDGTNGSLVMGTSLNLSNMTNNNTRGCVNIGYVSGSSETNLMSNVSGSMILGRGLRNTINNYSLLIGKYGTSMTSSTSGSDTIQTDGNFQIAGGVSSLGTNNTGSISVIIGTSVYSDISARGGGIADFWATTGADYAEYFQWNDNNEYNEDRIGYFVSLINDKIVLSPDSKNAIGITSSVSGTSGFIADNAEKAWSETLLKDKFGRVLTKYSYSASIKNILDKHHIEITDNINVLLQKDDEKIKQTIINLITSYIQKKEETTINFLPTFDKSVLTLHDNDHNINLRKMINTKKELKKEYKNDYKSNIKYKIPTDTHAKLKSIGTSDIPLTNTESKFDINNFIKDINNVQPVKTSIINPLYDPTKKYISRSSRKEWIPVGLIGKLYVRDNGLCIPGSKCDCENGIAVPGITYKILSRSANDVIKILFK